MYNKISITFDPAKNARNVSERGLSFENAEHFDWETAHIEEDIRKLYPERRFVAYGYLFGKFHICCFTPSPDGIRVISLRHGNVKEETKYEKETAHRQTW